MANILRKKISNNSQMKLVGIIQFEQWCYVCMEEGLYQSICIDPV